MKTLSATDADEMIAAIASAPGPASRGIIRVSGAGTVEVVTSFCRLDQTEIGTAARRFESEIPLTETATLAVSVFLWPTRRSYTGEPMAELHLPGSPPLLELVLEELFRRGIRPARRGEFTLRSFLAGRLDLAQAEAVLGVIDAYDSDELKTALKQLAGGLSGKIGEIRSVLLNVLADLEAGLDFVEEDIEFVSQQKLVELLSDCRATVAQLYEDADSRMHSTGRLRVVLAGLPNAGKSTLFNALTGRNSAIVSNETGTTRDWLSAPVESGNFDVVDTAGWEESPEVADPVGGIQSAAQQQRDEQTVEADLILWCTSADALPAEVTLDTEKRLALAKQHLPVLPVLTKVDCSSLTESMAMDTPLSWPPARAVSALSGEGIAELLSEIARQLTERRRGSRQLVGSTAARSRENLRRATELLGRAIEAAQLGVGDELVAIEIRAALDQLGEIVGAVYTDDILGRIFSRFCIGK